MLLRAPNAYLLGRVEAGVAADRPPEPVLLPHRHLAPVPAGLLERRMRRCTPRRTAASLGWLLGSYSKPTGWIALIPAAKKPDVTVATKGFKLVRAFVARRLTVSNIGQAIKPSSTARRRYACVWWVRHLKSVPPPPPYPPPPLSRREQGRY